MLSRLIFSVFSTCYAFPMYVCIFMSLFAWWFIPVCNITYCGGNEGVLLSRAVGVSFIWCTLFSSSLFFFCCCSFFVGWVISPPPPSCSYFRKYSIYFRFRFSSRLLRHLLTVLRLHLCNLFHYFGAHLFKMSRFLTKTPSTRIFFQDHRPF